MLNHQVTNEIPSTSNITNYNRSDATEKHQETLALDPPMRRSIIIHNWSNFLQDYHCRLLLDQPPKESSTYPMTTLLKTTNIFSSISPPYLNHHISTKLSNMNARSRPWMKKLRSWNAPKLEASFHFCQVTMYKVKR